jgi:hypothetical protein
MYSTVSLNPQQFQLVTKAAAAFKKPKGRIIEEAVQRLLQTKTKNPQTMGTLFYDEIEKRAKEFYKKNPHIKKPTFNVEDIDSGDAYVDEYKQYFPDLVK